MIDFSIGICAYNEEENIGRLLDALLRQKIPAGFDLKQILVVASGCTDGTGDAVRRLSAENNIIRLITEEERRGKSHAVNILLENLKTQVLCMIGADNVPSDDNSIGSIIAPFSDDDVGIVGGHPVPTNDLRTIPGFVGNFIWELHHQLSLLDPKIGEFIAFRPTLVERISDQTAVDEAFIESIITGKNYRKIYQPDAKVLNRSPESLSGILKQRKRVYIGHLHLAKTSSYKVSTMKYSSMLKPFFRAIKQMSSRKGFSSSGYFKVVAAVLIEGIARLSASIDFYLRHKNPYKWEIISTTKKI